jgi:hypothetical protein
MNITDLRDGDRSKSRPDPADLLEHSISAMDGQPVDNRHPEHVSFFIVGMISSRRERTRWR